MFTIIALLGVDFYLRGETFDTFSFGTMLSIVFIAELWALLLFPECLKETYS